MPITLKANEVIWILHWRLEIGGIKKKYTPIYNNFAILKYPIQHVELFNYESLTLKTVENLFLLVPW